MKAITGEQRVSLYLAHIFAFIALVLVAYWAASNTDNDYYLGGLGRSGTYLFNWHPVCMVAGLVVAYTEAIVSYRGLPFSHQANKAIHAAWQTAAVILVSVGLWAVFKYHNEELYANLYTAHSWVGIIVVTLFYSNYLGGLLLYGFGLGGEDLKAAVLPKHRFIGSFVYVAAAFTATLGIQDKTSALDCGYSITLTEADVNPAAHYSDIYEGCRVANSLAIVIVFCCLCASYAVWDSESAANSATPGNDGFKGAPLLG